MSQADSFRKGYQSEDWAKIILQKFCFVAKPTGITEDIGSDFFCTLFKVNKRLLFPQNSFAIQIKSKGNNKIDITEKQDYLNKLEIPFFVGIVDKKEMKLIIYSGEYIPNYFSHLPNHPNVKKLFIKLAEERSELAVSYKTYDDKCDIIFPKVAEIKADYDYNKNPERIDDLFSLCRLIQKNISSKVNNEFIFERFKSNWIDIFTGCGSAQHFKNNFLKRLAEVFYNLSWLYNNKIYPKENIKKEFEIYEKTYIELLKRDKILPLYLTSKFDELNKLLK